MAFTGARLRIRRLPVWSAGLTMVFLLWSVLPVAWVLKMSVSSDSELLSPTLLLHDATWGHYATVLTDPTFRSGLVNSLLIAGTTTLLCLTLGTAAAYPLARLRFRYRTPAMTGILSLAFFPAVAIIAPLFREFKSLGLLGTYQAVIAVDTAFALPLTIWIMAAFFRELPAELEEAARIDGAGVTQTFLRIIMPLALPGIVTAAILTFIAAWNEFLFANTFLFDTSTWPATVIIPNYATTRSTDYGAQAAATLMATVPLAAAVLLFQRRLVEGLTAGAVKG